MSALVDYEMARRKLANEFHVSTAILDDELFDNAVRRAITDRLEYMLLIDCGFAWPMPEIPEE